MKKGFTILTVLLVISGFFSCSDFLQVDKEIKDRLTLEMIFENRDYVEEWLANAYSFIMDANGDIGIGNMPYCFADDMYHSKFKSFKELTYNEESYQDTWVNAYRGIRQASIFIENVHPGSEVTEEEVTDFRAQARFVRAFYYWKLLQKYGPVPLLPEEGLDYTASYNDLSIPRNTYDECVDYIASEMALAAKDLPLRREVLSIARPTRGAALSVRAKALLYAASPLMNGNNDSYAVKMINDKGQRLLPERYSEEKWAKAAAAAKDVIDLNIYKLYVAYTRESGDLAYPKTLPPYNDGDFSQKNWPEGYADIDPFESYRSVFNGELSATENPELIFTRGQNQENHGLYNMVVSQLPLKAKGNNQTCMTQKQCDAYYMLDGTDCPGKDMEIGRGDGSQRVTGFVTDADVQAGLYKPLVKGVSLQYANREPRFYASVAYNGAVWNLLDASLEVDKGPYYCWYYRGGQEGQSNTGNWLITGIGVKKFVRPTDTNDVSSHVSKKADPAIRYAEILLIYAEALNELTTTHQIASWDGATTHSISRDINELKKGIQPIRIRAGVPDYNDADYADPQTFRKKLKRERQIELMGEGHRYFDLRRWKDVAEEESLSFYGCNTLMTEVEREQFHRPVEISSIRICFAEKTYFWPINRNELQKNVRLTQNPGWMDRTSL
jgi:hypothetical protein